MTTRRRRRSKESKVEMTLVALSAGRGDQARRDLDIAGRRVGDTAEKRARGLVTEFLPHDPREVSTPEHIAREHQAMAFVALAMSAAGSTLGEARLNGGTGGTFGDDHLREVWLQTRDLMRQWASGKPVPLPELTTRLQLRPDAGKDLRGQVVRIGEGRAAFFAAVVDLLSDPAVRVGGATSATNFSSRSVGKSVTRPSRAYHDREWNAKRKKKEANKSK